MMIPSHLRMARALLNWTLRDLEKRTGVNRNTISRYEAGKGILTGSLKELERVFIENGIVFIDEDNKFGPGIRMRRDLIPPDDGRDASLKKRSQKRS